LIDVYLLVHYIYPKNQVMNPVFCYTSQEVTNALEPIFQNYLVTGFLPIMNNDH